MTTNRPTRNSSKTAFLLIRLNNQFAKYTTSFGTSHSAWNLGFILDEHLTFSDQITSVSKACYYHICQLCCIQTYLDSSTACTIAISIVHSKLDCCNSSTMNSLSVDYLISSRFRTLLLVLLSKLLSPVISLPSYALYTGSESLNKLLSLTYEVLTTTQPPYFDNLMSVQRPRSMPTHCL